MNGAGKDLSDVLVIGGGPAGMFAAAAASLSGAKVTLLEKNGRPGRKMSIAGGGRCNLTNTASLPEFIKNIPGNGKFLFGALSRFSNDNCINFFKNLGVRTKEEEYGQVFPVGGRAGDVVTALEKYLSGSGVRIFYRARATELLFAGRRCRGAGTAGGGVFRSKSVIIATGGASYPQTGSTGDGYLLAQQAGHRIVPLLPGLSPLCCGDKQLCRQLQGLSLKDIVLTLFNEEGKRIAAEQGDVVFTHFGVSGPAALKLSRAVSAQTAAGVGSLRLLADVLPDVAEDALAGKLLSAAAAQPGKFILNLIKQFLPGRLAIVQAGKLSLDQHGKAGQAGKETWRKVARLIKYLPLAVTGTRPLSEAMVTVGGVSVDGIDPRTMASRLAEGLYFAGEVMDVDAYTGGFNMQIAFSTGWVAGRSAAGPAAKHNST